MILLQAIICAMNTNIKFEMRDNYLYIKGHGVRNSLSEMMEGALKLASKAQELKVYYLLIDYREMQYKVSHIDAFNVLRLYEQQAYLFKNLTVSIITNEHDIEMGKFFESLSRKRDFNYKVFLNEKEAEDWLHTEIKAKKRA